MWFSWLVWMLWAHLRLLKPCGMRCPEETGRIWAIIYCRNSFFHWDMTSWKRKKIMIFHVFRFFHEKIIKIPSVIWKKNFMRICIKTLRCIRKHVITAFKSRRKRLQRYLRVERPGVVLIVFEIFKQSFTNEILVFGQF